MLNRRFKKSLAALLSVAYFITQVALCHAIETNFWKERHQEKLAALPKTWANDIVAESPRFNAVRPARLSMTPKRTNNTPMESLLADVDFARGSIKEIHLATRKDAPRLLLLQDVHLNPEAQGNLSAILSALISKHTVNAVGVEGAFEKFDFSEFTRFPKEAVQKVSTDFLNENFLSAASHAGMNNPTTVTQFIGVDDAAHHARNVTAYINANTNHDNIAATLSFERKELQDALGAMNPTLKRYVSAHCDFADQKIGLGGYIKELSSLGASTSLETEQFLEASETESRLDFDKVNAERKSVLETLAQRLTETETRALINQSLLYRNGQLSFGAYYSQVKNLCVSHGINLKATPNFDDYIRYVLLADGINVDQLLTSIDNMENELEVRLATLGNAKNDMARLNHILLADKLIRFELTPAEWNKYKSGRAGEWAKKLAPFESFYTEADTRSELMLKNMPLDAKSDASVLIMGGFHSEEMTQLLRHRDISYAVITPKLTKLNENGNSYLSIFNREKTPLDKLFSGEKLFLSPTNVHATPASSIKWLATVAIALLCVTSAQAYDRTPQTTLLNSNVPGIYQIQESPAPVHTTLFVSDGDVATPNDRATLGGTPSSIKILTEHKPVYERVFSQAKERFESFSWSERILAFIGLLLFVAVPAFTAMFKTRHRFIQSSIVFGGIVAGGGVLIQSLLGFDFIVDSPGMIKLFGISSSVLFIAYIAYAGWPFIKKNYAQQPTSQMPLSPELLQLQKMIQNASQQWPAPDVNVAPPLAKLEQEATSTPQAEASDVPNKNSPLRLLVRQQYQAGKKFALPLGTLILTASSAYAGSMTPFATGQIRPEVGLFLLTAVLAIIVIRKFKSIRFAQILHPNNIFETIRSENRGFSNTDIASLMIILATLPLLLLPGAMQTAPLLKQISPAFWLSLSVGLAVAALIYFYRTILDTPFRIASNLKLIANAAYNNRAIISKYLESASYIVIWFTLPILSMLFPIFAVPFLIKLPLLFWVSLSAGIAVSAITILAIPPLIQWGIQLSQKQSFQRATLFITVAAGSFVLMLGGLQGWINYATLVAFIAALDPIVLIGYSLSIGAAAIGMQIIFEKDKNAETLNQQRAPEPITEKAQALNVVNDDQIYSLFEILYSISPRNEREAAALSLSQIKEYLTSDELRLMILGILNLPDDSAEMLIVPLLNRMQTDGVLAHKLYPILLECSKDVSYSRPLRNIIREKMGLGADHETDFINIKDPLEWSLEPKITLTNPDTFDLDEDNVHIWAMQTMERLQNTPWMIVFETDLPLDLSGFNYITQFTQDNISYFEISAINPDEKYAAAEEAVTLIKYILTAAYTAGFDFVVPEKLEFRDGKDALYFLIDTNDIPTLIQQPAKQSKTGVIPLFLLPLMLMIGLQRLREWWRTWKSSKQIEPTPTPHYIALNQNQEPYPYFPPAGLVDVSGLDGVVQDTSIFEPRIQKLLSGQNMGNFYEFFMDGRVPLNLKLNVASILEEQSFFIRYRLGVKNHKLESQIATAEIQSLLLSPHRSTDVKIEFEEVMKALDLLYLLPSDFSVLSGFISPHKHPGIVEPTVEQIDLTFDENSVEDPTFGILPQIDTYLNRHEYILNRVIIDFESSGMIDTASVLREAENNVFINGLSPYIRFSRNRYDPHNLQHIIINYSGNDSINDRIERILVSVMRVLPVANPFIEAYFKITFEDLKIINTVHLDMRATVPVENVTSDRGSKASLLPDVRWYNRLLSWSLESVVFSLCIAAIVQLGTIGQLPPLNNTIYLLTVLLSTTLGILVTSIAYFILHQYIDQVRLKNFNRNKLLTNIFWMGGIGVIFSGAAFAICFFFIARFKPEFWSPVVFSVFLLSHSLAHLLVNSMDAISLGTETGQAVSGIGTRSSLLSDIDPPAVALGLNDALRKDYLNNVGDRLEQLRGSIGTSFFVGYNDELKKSDYLARVNQAAIRDGLIKQFYTEEELTPELLGGKVPALTFSNDLNSFNEATIRYFIDRLQGKSGVVLVPEKFLHRYLGEFQSALKTGAIQILPARFTGQMLHLDQPLQDKLPGSNPSNVLFILKKDMIIDAPAAMSKEISVMMLDELLNGMILRAYDLGTIDKIAKLLSSQA